MWPLVKINPIIKIKNREKNKTLAKTGCVILDRVRIKNVWIHHVDRNIGNCLNKTKAVQENESANKQGLASECRYSQSRPTNDNVSGRTTAFLVDPILQNTDKQSQLFGQAPGKSHSDPLKTKILIRNIVTNSIRICNKINFKYSVDGILHYFANHINNHQK